MTTPADPLAPGAGTPATAVLLDLDGTITDSAGAITHSISESLAAFGYPAQTPAQLLRFVGPPIRDGLQRFAGVTDADLEAVVADYRDRYGARMLDVPVFPGMADLVRDLHAAGVPIALATSKMLTMARPILEYAGLDQYFTVICGATADETRSAKADIVTDALDGLRAAGADVSGAVMVGDRHHDVQGAAANGIPAVLVRWGYAQPGEEAGARAVVADAGELAAVLGAAAPARR
ncbi:HAD hydrolase-like protein [Georgenia ruanii]|uniref:HAD hydrolase-like protein n=1 Tax=Georgenia ruanii TaxID=348442 RepID=A0A7J9V214_9MICO|nr:HAD hydrolase-like protein [Georgenia ruanii]MPV90170.1 HAD hydrolase-like protein [Georgenia ruanii]